MHTWKDAAITKTILFLHRLLITKILTLSQRVNLIDKQKKKRKWNNTRVSHQICKRTKKGNKEKNVLQLCLLIFCIFYLCVVHCLSFPQISILIYWVFLGWILFPSKFHSFHSSFLQVLFDIFWVLFIYLKIFF